jgi:hypothetical protein
MELRGRIAFRGVMRAYERPEGSRIWRHVGDFPNIVLNQWYADFFPQLMPDPPGGMSLALLNLALGYAPSPAFVRTDTGLTMEWSTTVATLTVASGVAAGTTSLTVSALPLKIPNAHTVVLGAAPGTPQTLTLTADANPAATTLAVAAFTPNQNWPIGTPIIFNDITYHVPQRLSNIIGFTDPTDPPNVTASFYLPASGNSEPLTFTEAGLLYNTNTKFASHAAFAYTKSGNTDLRLDYNIVREV